MESNGLLSGEMARRNKDATTLTNPSNPNVQSNASKECNNDAADWTMALYQSTYQKPTPDEFKVANYSVPLNGLVTMNPNQHEVEEQGKMGNHMSNPSSLVTSLGSSREGSPDKNNALATQFGLSQMGAKFYPGSGSGVNPWIQSGQIRPQVPLFSAWTDAS